ncbi:MAG: hypothetical protein QM783_11160 [Phycisphaerales bacterium]
MAGSTPGPAARLSAALGRLQVDRVGRERRGEAAVEVFEFPAEARGRALLQPLEEELHDLVGLLVGDEAEAHLG